MCEKAVMASVAASTSLYIFLFFYPPVSFMSVVKVSSPVFCNRWFYSCKGHCDNKLSACNDGRKCAQDIFVIFLGLFIRLIVKIQDYREVD